MGGVYVGLNSHIVGGFESVHITSVIVKNQHVPLEAKHRDVFRFYTLDELKSLELDNYA